MNCYQKKYKNSYTQVHRPFKTYKNRSKYIVFLKESFEKYLVVRMQISIGQIYFVLFSRICVSNCKNAKF